MPATGAGDGYLDSGVSSHHSGCSIGRKNNRLTATYFNCRYEKEFDNVQDVFELQVWSYPSLLVPYTFILSNDSWCQQRNLNNAFAYDLVPSVGVMTAALKAARRVNDFPTAVRIFEGPLRIPSQ